MNRRELLVQIAGVAGAAALPTPLALAEKAIGPIRVQAELEARVAKIADWSKPWGRRTERHFQNQIKDFGGLILNSSPEHRSCLDCEHIRVGGMPSRACVKRPMVALWFMDAESELANGYTSTVETGFVPNIGGADKLGCIRTRHPGQTMADVCPFFQMDAGFTGRPTLYIRDVWAEEETRQDKEVVLSDFKTIYEHIVTDPRYLTNIEYGKPRRGHAEGTVKAHIADLEANLAKLVARGLVDADSERYWKLRVLIHVHDSFKMEAKRDSMILDPQSHASLARAYLLDLTPDWDMLQITQFHDIGFAVFKKHESTGRFEEERILKALGCIRDKDLFLLFAIIDACTPSKGRKMIQWFVKKINEMFSDTTIKPEHILPGPDLIGESW